MEDIALGGYLVMGDQPGKYVITRLCSNDREVVKCLGSEEYLFESKGCEDGNREGLRKGGACKLGASRGEILEEIFQMHPTAMLGWRRLWRR